MPIPYNTTCDIVSVTGTVTQGVNIHLKPDWPMGQEHGDRHVNELTWTHIAFLPLDVPVRDRYTGHCTYDDNNDVFYVPQVQAGTPFLVIFIEIMLFGQAQSYKKVYLDRQTPPWPTDNL